MTAPTDSFDSHSHARATTIRVGVVVLSAAAAAALFAPTARFDLIWDDPRLLQEALPALESWRDLLLPPRGVADFDRYYRPLAYGTLLLVDAVGGGRPFAFHLAAIALHAICTGLVAWLSLRLLAGLPTATAAALAAGLLFATHPVHVETVAWAGAAMNELPTTLFLLASLIAYEAACQRGTGGAYVAALAFALLAFAGKETALVLPALAAALELRVPSDGARRWPNGAWRVAGLGVPTATYLGLRHAALGGWLLSPEVIPEQSRSLTAVPAAILFYLERLFVPFSNCHMAFELPATGYADGAIFVLLAMGAAGLVLAAWRRGAFVVPYGAVWVGIGIAPAVALAVYTVATLPLAERYAYIPSIGVSLILGGVMVVAARWRRASWAVVVLVLLACVYATSRRQAAFASDGAFWTAARACAPGHCLPAIMLGDLSLRASDLDGAESLYKSSLELTCVPREQGLAWAHLGVCRYQRGDLTEAERLLTTARPLAPRYSLTPYLLARIATTRSDEARRAGDSQKARAELERARSNIEAALELRPGNAEYVYVAGQVAYLLGDEAAARRHLEEALRMSPRHEIAPAARAILDQVAPR